MNEQIYADPRMQAQHTRITSAIVGAWWITPRLSAERLIGLMWSTDDDDPPERIARFLARQLLQAADALGEPVPLQVLIEAGSDLAAAINEIIEFALPPLTAGELQQLRVELVIELSRLMRPAELELQ